MSKKVVKLKDREAERKAELQEMAELHAEVLSCDSPSEKARAYFDAGLEASPDAWRHLGDLTAAATEHALEKFWLGYATKASVLKGAEVLKAELGYAEATPMIKLLIEQAVLCHIRLGIVEHNYSRQLGGSYSLVVGAHWEMRLTLCQRRYMKALMTLAKVRGLLARAEVAEMHAMRRAGTASPKGLKVATG